MAATKKAVKPQAQTTELIVVPTAETALAVFTTPGGLDPYLDQIRAQIDGFVADVSTKKGRDEVASLAYSITRSKTALDEVGKKLVAEYKDLPKKIDFERKQMRDLLDDWRDTLRAPLTAYEAAEEARVATHREHIDAILEYSVDLDECDCKELDEMLVEVRNIKINKAWEEFELEAHRAQDSAIAALETALAKRQKYEKEQAELKALRELAAKRNQEDRERVIAEEARVQALREERLKQQRDLLKTQREQEEKDRVHRLELEAADRREATAKRDKELAEARAAAAENSAKEAEKRAKATKEAEELATKVVESAKAANARHRRGVEARIVRAITMQNIPVDLAERVVNAIVAGEIPYVSIGY